jgi:Short C-terminal domain
VGVRNLRAICPNCGGKIHTQPKGLGHITWANSRMLAKTGTECQHCGVALSGKVGVDNKAILAKDADKSWWQRQKEAAGVVSAEPDEATDSLNSLGAEWKRSGKPKPDEVREIDGIEARWGPRGWEPVDEAQVQARQERRDELIALVDKLDDLRDAGVLSDDEYAAKRAEIDKHEAQGS